MPKTDYSPVVDMPANSPFFDFSIGKITDVMADATTGIGKYNERRQDVYSDFFHGERNIHVGVDLFMPAGTTVKAFSKGEIFMTAYNSALGDYGYTIICKHKLHDGREIYALYGHLSSGSTSHKLTGQTISQGETIGWIGDESENGGWPPHVHFQLSWEAPETCDMPGVVAQEDLPEALQLYPDPASILDTVDSK